MKETVVLALATMLGVGYLVFRAGGGGFAAPSGSGGSVSSEVGAAPSRVPVSSGRLVLGRSSGLSSPVEHSTLPEWFIKSVETPLPKKFEPAIYMHQIEALRARGY